MADLCSLAYAEMRMILARMIWNFDMVLQEDSQTWAEDERMYGVWSKGSLNVRLLPVIR